MNKEEMLALFKKGIAPIDIAIQKWKDITEGKGIDEGMRNCALCEVYIHRYFRQQKVGCSH